MKLKKRKIKVSFWAVSHPPKTIYLFSSMLICSKPIFVLFFLPLCYYVPNHMFKASYLNIPQLLFTWECSRTPPGGSVASLHPKLSQTQQRQKQTIWEANAFPFWTKLDIINSGNYLLIIMKCRSKKTLSWSLMLPRKLITREKRICWKCVLSTDTLVHNVHRTRTTTMHVHVNLSQSCLRERFIKENEKNIQMLVYVRLKMVKY